MPSDFNNKMPQMGAGDWVWDMPVTVCDMMIKSGITRNTLYDPAFPEQNNETLWTYTVGEPGGAYGFRVIGYCMTFPGTAGLIATNANPTLNPPAGISPSDRPLVACATISNGANEANRAANIYTGIYGGWGPHRAPHLDARGKVPIGGTVGMVDGSARWVKFPAMHVRANGPNFWW